MSQLSHEQMSKLLGNRSKQQTEIPNISPDDTANLLAISGMWKAALGIQPADPAWEKVACGSGLFPSHQFLQQASLRAAIAIQQTYGIMVLANGKTAGASKVLHESPFLNGLTLVCSLLMHSFRIAS
jgi:hypothetical protein